MAVSTLAISQWKDAPTVTLLVGKTKAVFHVHEAILFDASYLLKAACESKFREGSERIMTLPDDDESVFELFVDWLYVGHYPMRSLEEQGPPDTVDKVFLRLVKLLIFANKYGVPNLRSHVLSTVFALIKESFVPTLDTIAYAYEHTSRNAGIRRLFADHLACNFKPDVPQFQDLLENIRVQPDLGVDMVLSFSEHMLSINNPFDGEMPEHYEGQGFEHGS